MVRQNNNTQLKYIIMPLVKPPFEQQIKFALSGGSSQYAKLTGESKTAIDKVAADLATAIDLYIKSQTITVTTAVTTAVASAAGPGVGTGVGTGTGLVS